MRVNFVSTIFYEFFKYDLSNLTCEFKFFNNHFKFSKFNKKIKKHENLEVND
jgi:hypothetical protein